MKINYIKKPLTALGLFSLMFCKDSQVPFNRTYENIQKAIKNSNQKDFIASIWDKKTGKNSYTIKLSDIFGELKEVNRKAILENGDIFIEDYYFRLTNLSEDLDNYKLSEQLQVSRDRKKWRNILAPMSAEEFSFLEDKEVLRYTFGETFKLPSAKGIKLLYTQELEVIKGEYAHYQDLVKIDFDNKTTLKSTLDNSIKNLSEKIAILNAVTSTNFTRLLNELASVLETTKTANKAYKETVNAAKKILDPITVEFNLMQEGKEAFDEFLKNDDLLQAFKAKMEEIKNAASYGASTDKTIQAVLEAFKTILEDTSTKVESLQAQFDAVKENFKTF
jgi:hypothetical protein